MSNTAKTYLYYPGCSLKGSAVDYEESFLAVASSLGIEIREVEGWDCCGASVVKSVDEELAGTLPIKALASADKAGMDLLMLCPSCSLNHLRLALKAEKDEEFMKGLSLGAAPKVKHFIEVLAFEIGAEEISRQITRPLKGIKALPYYGCLIARPHPIGGRESLENPKVMENIIGATGAEPLFFPYKVDCCGGTIMLSREEVALKLGSTILQEAKRLSPDCIVVVCPLCQFMLDAKQRAVEKELGEKIGLPVLYITQLLGLALGIDYKKLGIQRLVTSPKPFLQKISQ